MRRDGRNVNQNGDGLGLPAGEVRLVDYDPAWPRLFDEEARRLREALGAGLAALEHIGSTAVPGLAAKPILDIAAAVADLSGLPALVAALEAAGYAYKGEYGLPGRHFFTLGDPARVHLHVVVQGSGHWSSWIALRDRLRADPDLRARYAALKAGLAAQHARDRDAYTAAKSGFIREALEGSRPSRSDLGTEALRERVTRAAERVLVAKGMVSPLDLVLEMRLVAACHVREWEKGIHACLAPHIQGSPRKKELIYRFFSEWVSARGLRAIAGSLRRAGRDGVQELRVTSDADPAVETFFRTYWASAEASARRAKTLEKKANKPPELVVFMTVSESVICAECGAPIAPGGFLSREADQTLCLACADMDHLQFLPSGDAALSRRARKLSPLAAVVLQFNRRSGRYERRGILAAPAAIEEAERLCLSDADRRAARRAEGALQRAREDVDLQHKMAEALVALFPGCPAREAEQIAAHTARRNSGRVGRSAAGRDLQPEALRLAVVAHIRHEHTDYDRLLMDGCDRAEARAAVADAINVVLDRWTHGA